MATNPDPAFRFATNVFDTDGTDKVYDISFELGYIEKEYVFAMSGVEDPSTGLLTGTMSHTVSFIDANDGNRIKVSPVPATGRKLVVFRQTDISDLLVKFQDGKLLTGRNLDLSATQLLMAIQEILDGLRNNNTVLEGQVDNIINLDQLIRSIYEQVIELLASGGIVSVTPRVWSGVGDGATADYPMVGADVEDAGFYDTYISGLGLVPDSGFTVELGATPADTVMRFSANVPDGAEWFTVLRGYAKPYTGPQPITNLDIPIIDAMGEVFIADEASRYGIVLCNNPAGCEVTIKEITIGADQMRTGSYFSFLQLNVGAVTLVPDTGMPEFVIAAQCKAETRGVGCTITATCLDADTNRWLISGDLAKE